MTSKALSDRSDLFSEASNAFALQYAVEGIFPSTFNAFHTFKNNLVMRLGGTSLGFAMLRTT